MKMGASGDKVGAANAERPEGAIFGRVSSNPVLPAGCAASDASAQRPAAGRERVF